MRPISGVANLGRSALDRPIHRMYDGLYLAPARPGLGCVSYVCGAWRVSTGVACAYLLGPLSVVCDCEELWRSPVEWRRAIGSRVGRVERMRASYCFHFSDRTPD